MVGEHELVAMAEIQAQAQDQKELVCPAHFWHASKCTDENGGNKNGRPAIDRSLRPLHLSFQAAKVT